MRALVGIVALAGLLLAACGGVRTIPAPSDDPTTTAPAVPSPRSPDPGDAVPIRAEAARATATDVTEDELFALVAGDTCFALDLYDRAAGGTNLVLSPYGVARALTMAYAGARSDTAAEMRAVLHLGPAGDRVHPARNELDLRITTPGGSSPVDERTPFTLRVADSLWAQRDYRFRAPFLTTLAEHYGAGIHLVDFVEDPAAARRTMNTWVERETEGRITELIPEGTVDDLTRLVLVDAVWFEASWRVPFDPDLTADAAFVTLDGEEVTVPMMAGSLRTGYVDGDDYTAVRLPYLGDASMLLVLPDPDRFDAVASRFDPSLLAEIDEGLSDHEVALRMPRFEFRTTLPLTEVLRALGMVTAFTPPSESGGADFSGMTGAREPFLGDVAHEAFVDVDEHGTEAAAATAVVVRTVSAAPPATLDLDRPFLFVVRHDPTGEILFLGQVSDPSAG